MKTTHNGFYRTEIRNTGLIPMERVTPITIHTDDQGRPIDRNGQLYPMPGFPLTINGVRCRSLNDEATIFMATDDFDRLDGAKVLVAVEGLAFTNVDYTGRKSRYVVHEDQYDLEELDENAVPFQEVVLTAHDGHVCKAEAFLDPTGMDALSELNCHDFTYLEWLLEKLQAKLDNKLFVVMQVDKHDEPLMGRYATEEEANDRARELARLTPKAQKGTEGYQVVDIEKSKIFEPCVTLFVPVGN